jgi:hypothetical protein
MARDESLVSLSSCGSAVALCRITGFPQLEVHHDHRQSGRSIAEYMKKQCLSVTHIFLGFDANYFLSYGTVHYVATVPITLKSRD